MIYLIVTLLFLFGVLMGFVGLMGDK